MNGNLEGVYEMPATIPLHYEGLKNLVIYPGIKRNGIAADRKKYPFYLPFDTICNLIPDSVLNIIPQLPMKKICISGLKILKILNINFNLIRYHKLIYLL